MNSNKQWDASEIKHFKTVEKIKTHMRKGNSNYLCQHPEIRAIIRVFIHEAINKQPKNIYEFGAELFNCNDSPLLARMVNQQLKRVNETLKNNRYSEYDGEMLFTPTESSHSLLSQESIPERMNSILKYAMVLR